MDLSATLAQENALLNGPGPNSKLCTRCLKWKPKTLFAKHTPLADVTNTVADELAYHKTCSGCRQRNTAMKQKRRSDINEQRQTELMNCPNNSWENILNAINGGFVAFTSRIDFKVLGRKQDVPHFRLLQALPVGSGTTSARPEENG